MGTTRWKLASCYHHLVVSRRPFPNCRDSVDIVVLDVAALVVKIVEPRNRGRGPCGALC